MMNMRPQINAGGYEGCVKRAREARRLAELREMIGEIERLRLALRIIAGKEQCIDNLMSNADVALAALGREGEA
jgi:hypothetical protein